MLGGHFLKKTMTAIVMPTHQIGSHPQKIHRARATATDSTVTASGHLLDNLGNTPTATKASIRILLRRNPNPQTIPTPMGTAMIDKMATPAANINLVTANVSRGKSLKLKSSSRLGVNIPTIQVPWSRIGSFEKSIPFSPTARVNESKDHEDQYNNGFDVKGC